MNKKKILFVVVDFFKGGAERFAYEIDCALDKNNYEITILCLGNKINNNRLWERYYDKKHNELGTKIYYFDDYLYGRKNYLISKFIKKTFGIKTTSYFKKNKLVDFISQYDIVHWMGEYTYLHNLPETIVKRSIINSMSAKFQNPDLYKKFNFNYKYNFLSGFSKNEFEVEYSQFKSINHWFFPLVFKINNDQRDWNYVDSKIKKIGIFTR